MEIVKYKKKKNNKYLITLSNGDSLELFEEVILKNNLLIKKDIDSSDINFIINDQQFYSCYYDILKMIRVRPRSIYDNYVEEEKVSKIIDKMIKSNRNKGNNYLRRKIYNDLLRDGFSKSIVDKVISSKEFSDDSEIKAREYEKIKARLQKKYSGNELEYKINDALIKKGFNIN